MRLRAPVPKPRSAYLLVRCDGCGNEQIVYSHTTVDIECKVCGSIIAEKRGGRARIYGRVLRRVD